MKIQLNYLFLNYIFQMKEIFLKIFKLEYGN